MKFSDRWFSVLHAARSLREIAESLKQIESLYRLELLSQGIVQPNADVQDEVEVIYGPQTPSRSQE